MTEGTKSWLFGCHSIMHSILIVKAWWVLYKDLPNLWQLICILFHDIGYCGKNYLTEKSNSNHAELGARLGKLLFGEKARLFLLGHSRSAAAKYGIELSKLEAPDDYSWIIAPAWWLKFNTIVEPQLYDETWREAVKKNWEGGIDNRRPTFEVAKDLLQGGINESK